MLAPHLAADEQARQTLLTTLGILDSPRVEELDRITRLAARHFHVKAVLVSLIDADRQWFLSYTGLQISQSPRDISFCGHAILQQEILVVTDARQDDRFYDNPMVLGEPRIVFYAGCQLRSREGITLGTLCLLDDKARDLDTEDQQALSDMTALVQSYIFSLERRLHTQKVENDLLKSELLFEQTFSHAAVGFSLLGMEWNWLRINPQVCRMLGYSELELQDKSVRDLVHPQDRHEETPLLPQLLSGEIDSFTVEKLLIKKDGEPIWTSVTASLVRTVQGEPHHYIVVLNDITERKRIEQSLYQLQQDLEQRVIARTHELQVAIELLHQEMSQRMTRERELTESKNRLRAITDNMPALICHVNADQRYTFINQFHTDWFGIPEQQITQMTVQQVLGQDNYLFAEPLIEQVLKGKSVSYEIEIPRNPETGQGGILHTTLIPCDNPQDGFYGLSTDITEIKELQAQLEYEANHDSLTGLPNRRAFQHILNDIARQQEYAVQDVALLFLDIDNFKGYNDRYGHEFGDLVLKCFGRTLRDNVRSQDIVARLAGDEFVILLNHIEAAERDVPAICRGLLMALSENDRIAGVPITLSASIGVAYGHAQHSMLPDSIMARADAAMYQAKQTGKGRYIVEEGLRISRQG